MATAGRHAKGENVSEEWQKALVQKEDERIRTLQTYLETNAPMLAWTVEPIENPFLPRGVQCQVTVQMHLKATMYSELIARTQVSLIDEGALEPAAMQFLALQMGSAIGQAMARWPEKETP